MSTRLDDHARLARDPGGVARPIVSPAEFRSTMAQFGTGVALVMAESPTGEPHGCTINSLTSVSLEPATLLVSLKTDSRMSEVICASRRYSVSILSRRQQHLAAAFARPGEARFEGLQVHRGPLGLPVAPGAVAILECRVKETFAVEDHTLFVAHVESADHHTAGPLLFHAGTFGSFLHPQGEFDPWA